MELTKIDPAERRKIIATVIVENGVSNAIAGVIPGYLIARLETVFAEIADWQNMENKKGE